jgi:hypothetical protein
MSIEKAVLGVAEKAPHELVLPHADSENQPVWAVGNLPFRWENRTVRKLRGWPQVSRIGGRMTRDSDAAGVLRIREKGEQRVTPLELFFGLVYVFAVTQLSHLLLDHPSLGGALQTLFLLLVVWWAWQYTAWFTNWFDPDTQYVRLVLVAVMLASLVMSAAIPAAFGKRGLMFALALAALAPLGPRCRRSL